MFGQRKSGRERVCGSTHRRPVTLRPLCEQSTDQTPKPRETPASPLGAHSTNTEWVNVLQYSPLCLRILKVTLKTPTPEGAGVGGEWLLMAVGFSWGDEQVLKSIVATAARPWIG